MASELISLRLIEETVSLIWLRTGGVRRETYPVDLDSMVWLRYMIFYALPNTYTI